MTEPQTPVALRVDVLGLISGQGEGDPASEALSAPEKRKATLAAKAYATGFRIGDQVTAHTPRSPRFDGKHGIVATTNLGEVGVSFTAGDSVDAWFAPAELWRSA